MNGPFTEYGVKEFLKQILSLLKYLHRHEIIHRDIKPANIIRRNVDNKLVLIDFGAVKDEINQTTMLNSASSGQILHRLQLAPRLCPLLL